MTLELKKAGQKLRSARKAEEAAFDAVKRAAIEAIAEGMTEVQVAQEGGVDRMTVRKWRGKR